MALESQNLLNILNQNSKARMVEEYMRKELLMKPEREGVLAKSQYGMSLGLPTESGQYMRLTQTRGLRRPQKMTSPGGNGSDPSSPATTGVNDMNVPLEWIHEYVQIPTVTQQTSWLDFKNILRGGMRDSLHLRYHELTQNAMFVGRYKPGKYDSDGDLSQAFDTDVEATVTLYGNSFTFKSAPKYYAGLAATYDDFASAGKKTSYTDLASIATRLKISKVPAVMNGKYVCVLSQSMMNDMLTDPDLDPRIYNSLLASGSKARKGMEDGWLGEYGQLIFMEDDTPYTINSASETTRADWGEIHGAMIFGKEAWGKLKLGNTEGATMPNPKIQDVTKVGYAVSIGYLVPGQVAVVNSNNCATYKAFVTEALPNNYSETNKQKPFGGESLGD